MAVAKPSSSSTLLLWVGGTCLVAVAVSAVALWQSSSTSTSRRPRHYDDDDYDDEEDDNEDAMTKWLREKEVRPKIIEDDNGGEMPPHMRRDIYKEKRRQEKIPLLAMKKPMYDNIRMLDPQGTVLCTISKKKANWYVNKSLAVWKDEDDKTTIQLLFEPSHRSNQSDDNKKDEQDAFFNKSIKQNICVVCGHDQYHMRHYIVPYACRALLPNKYKKHMAHDVVILCPDCHLECKKQATQRLKYLEKCCRKDPNTATPHTTDRHLYKVKSCALALLRWRSNLPPDTIQEYETLLQQHFQLADTTVVTEELLQQAIQVEEKIPNPHYIPPSEVIVEAMCQTDEDIQAFVKGWRKHFVRTMAPRFLPKGWNVDSNVQCMSTERKEG
ncbi:Exonuclease 3'-5' domain-containing protein 2 [Seminavis robusta]|uniref:Exonuclease 3'-5' domain-containing protein 2 n=1 Tax=Seminavis robusta TaxID=568900 RepID=A0A9N8EX37_9STRA|nr:Exonuclease 3'-5' domain-containing protein 2 [Seminavis robusta]|eukprot:Sro1863_g302310.1 Exonuclease 3'-5' domain-containing protein 2 (384) ;mRNA; f:6702-7853